MQLASAWRTGQPRRFAGPELLQAHRLRIARGGYLILLVLSLGLFALGVPRQFEQLGVSGLGQRVSLDSEGQLVLWPAPRLRATAAGIGAGEILVGINGMPVRAGEMTPETWREVLQAARAPVDLEVRLADGSTRSYAVGGEQVPVGPLTYAQFRTGLDVLLVLGFTIPSLLIFWRRSDDGFAIFLAAALLTMGPASTGALMALLTDQPAWMLPVVVVTFVSKLSTLLFFFLFPSGQLVPGWTRRCVGIAVVWAIWVQLPGSWSPWSWPYAAGTMVDLSLYGIGLYSQVARYRRHSSPKEREQTRWVMLGMGVTLVGVYAYILPPAFSPVLQESLASALPYHAAGRALAYLALLGVPLTLTISILRYQLYDIDLIINRTLVYVPLTAFVAGLLSASITLSQRLFISYTGEQSSVTIAFATLIIAATFTPVKERLQRLVDRYFKEVPDPGKRLQAFAERVENRLFPVEPVVVMRQLLEEAVLAFGAGSGAVLQEVDGRPHLLHATRTWNHQPELTAPLHSRVLIALGPRPGDEYTSRDAAVLQRIASAVARAIEEDVRTQARAVEG